MINFLAPVAFLRHRNHYFRQNQIAPWRFVASSAEKTVQLYLLPSLSLLVFSVRMEGPQEARGGSAMALCKRPERRWEECKEIPSAKLVPSWGYCHGEEPRDSPFYWSIWDLLRCLVLQSNRSVFSFSQPQSWSLVQLSVIQIWTTAYHCGDRNLTSPPEGRV